MDRHWLDDGPEDLVTQYWDALVRGQDPGTAPDHATTIRQVYERARTPKPSPGFAADLEATLMDAAALRGTRAQDTHRLDARESVSRGRTLFSPRPGRNGTSRLGDTLGLLAAAVLVLTLLGGSLAGSRILQRRPATSPPPQLPSLEAVQAAATPQPDGATMRVITHAAWEVSENQGAPLHDPFGIGIDPQGNVWVANEHSGDFAIFAPDGRLIETWGTPGSADGQFAKPQDVAFAPDGTFYVADAGNHRIQQFAPDRSFLRSWSDAATKSGPLATATTAVLLGSPTMIKVAPDSTVYVADDDRSVIERYTRDGQWLNSLGSGILGKAPGAMAFAPDGTVWVADYGYGTLKVFRPDGTFLRTVGIPGSNAVRLDVPNALAFDAAGRLYVPDAYKVQIFDTSLRLLGHTRRGQGGYSSQVDVELGPDGRIYTTDYMLGILSAFDLNEPVSSAVAGAPALLVQPAPVATPTPEHAAVVPSSPLVTMTVFTGAPTSTRR